MTIFNHKAHKALWQHMAAKRTIKNIVKRYNESSRDMEDAVMCEKHEWCIKNDYFKISRYCFSCDAVDKLYYDKKIDYNDYISNKCSYCPLKVGKCKVSCVPKRVDGKYVYLDNSLWINYCRAIWNFNMGRETIEKVQEFAKAIKNAELNIDIIDKYKIQVE